MLGSAGVFERRPSPGSRLRDRDSCEEVWPGGAFDLLTASNSSRTRLQPEDVLTRIPGVDYETLVLEPGDGRVTKASLLGRDSLAPDAQQPGFFPISYAIFICRGHAALPSDVTFRDNLLNLLLY